MTSIVQTTQIQPLNFSHVYYGFQPLPGAIQVAEETMIFMSPNLQGQKSRGLLRYM